MRHFGFIPQQRQEQLFAHRPQELGPTSDAALLAVGLGATLYTPGIRTTLVKDVVKAGSRGCMSQVLCLEDSISDDDLEQAERNVAQALCELNQLRRQKPEVQLPMLFVRVRSPKQMLRLGLENLESLQALTGFVLPKFENINGQGDQYFRALERIDAAQLKTGLRGAASLKVMPILESPSIIHRETRTPALTKIVEAIRLNRSKVLAVRIGATDFSSIFGLRRPQELTIYDVHVVASVISDIVNILGRPEDSLVITGPVWEYFGPKRSASSPDSLATLRREITMDHANGLLGKTVIHPKHVPVVNALSVVSHEDYADAQDILSTDRTGAVASSYKNKMNEIKPHRAWAARTLLRAQAFGVAAKHTTVADLLEAAGK